TSNYFGHACEREVSECLYLSPEIVREEKLEIGDINTKSFATKYFRNEFVKVVYQFDEITNNGNLGDGTKGNYKLGEEIIQEALGNMSEFISEFSKVER